MYAGSISKNVLKVETLSKYQNHSSSSADIYIQAKYKANFDTIALLVYDIKNFLKTGQYF